MGSDLKALTARVTALETAAKLHVARIGELEQVREEWKTKANGWAASVEARLAKLGQPKVEPKATTAPKADLPYPNGLPKRLHELPGRSDRGPLPGLLAEAQEFHDGVPILLADGNRQARPGQALGPIRKPHRVAGRSNGVFGVHINSAKDKVTLSFAGLFGQAQSDSDRSRGPSAIRRKSLQLRLAKARKRPIVRCNESSGPTLSFVGNFG